MARALWDSRSERDRAVALSEQARDALLKAGKAKTKLYREVEAWLSSRAPARPQM
jgi:hypothetical protein